MVLRLAWVLLWTYAFVANIEYSRHSRTWSLACVDPRTSAYSTTAANGQALSGSSFSGMQATQRPADADETPDDRASENAIRVGMADA